MAVRGCSYKTFTHAKQAYSSRLDKFAIDKKLGKFSVIRLVGSFLKPELRASLLP